MGENVKFSMEAPWDATEIPWDAMEI